MARGGFALSAPVALPALALAACTQTTPQTDPDPEPAPPPATQHTASTTPSSRPTDAPDQPLVLAVHHTSPLREVTLRRARRIVAGATRLEVASGAPRLAVRAVVRDPSLVAVIPADAVEPQVRALRVKGVDPIQRPGIYPLRTAAAAAQQPVIRLTVVGDIMLGRGVAMAARGSADPAPALRPMARRLAEADITVGNLENTLSQAGAPRQGSDSFAADPGVIRSLRAAGFDALSLANNHVGDFGDRSLVQTVRRLRAGGIATFGAGADVRQAWQPAVVERHGVRYGFVGFNAIGETPSVRPGRPGAVSVGMPPRTGPLDEAALRRFERAVRRLDRTVDVVVTMPHWGTQYTNRPEPVQRLVARRLVRAGADVVVGGHPHWLQGMEFVRGRLVAHSLGNFVFDMDFMRRTMEGAALELTFWGGDLKAVHLVPYVMDAQFAPRVVTGAEASRVLTTLRETSGPAFRGR
jgi:poly-gamma-glutamate capsule biosynthesis protein CapA/YwtB (metallophosphatase superfamily)